MDAQAGVDLVEFIHDDGSGGNGGFGGDEAVFAVLKGGRSVEELEV